MNSFGTKFRLSLFGESHGDAVGIVIDGVRAGIRLDVSDFEPDLGRRRSGSEGTTPRVEKDIPEIITGVFNGRTTGAPLTILFRNENTRSGDYENLTLHPRPSHADRVAAVKFRRFNDYRGGGHFSGRLTVALVAAGVVAKKHIDSGITLHTEIIEIGGVRDRAKFDAVVKEAVEAGDSVGGVIECRAENIPTGLGEPFFDSVESIAAHLLFSVPAVKGVEFGAGFRAASHKGSSNNDRILDAAGRTATNNDGGINGGISNGNPIVVRVAVKPTASISMPQQTFDFETGRLETLTIRGRHDACIALRAAVVVEAAMAVALAQF